MPCSREADATLHQLGGAAVSQQTEAEILRQGFHRSCSCFVP